MKGIEYKTFDGKKILFHFMLSSYIADITKCDDMLILKCGTKTSSPCHNCLMSKNKFASRQASTKRTLKNSLDMLASAKSGTLSAEVELQIKPVLCIPPVPFEFSFIAIHSSGNIYSIS